MTNPGQQPRSAESIALERASGYFENFRRMFKNIPEDRIPDITEHVDIWNGNPRASASGPFGDMESMSGGNATPMVRENSDKNLPTSPVADYNAMLQRMDTLEKSASTIVGLVGQTSYTASSPAHGRVVHPSTAAPDGSRK